MSKIFEWNANDGSYIARTGQVGTLTANVIGFKKSSKGFGWQSTNIITGSSGVINFGSNINFDVTRDLTKPFTLVNNIKVTAGSKTFYQYLYAKNSGSSTYRGVLWQKGNNFTTLDLLVNYDLGNNNYIGKSFNYNFKKDSYYNIILTYDGSLKALGFNCYVNGVKITSYTVSRDTLTNSNLSNSGNFYIGRRSDGFNNSTNEYLTNIVYDNLLSESEIQQEYISFLNQKPHIKPIQNFYHPQPKDYDPSLIADYDFQDYVRGNVVYNKALPNPANGFNHTFYNLLCGKGGRKTKLGETFYAHNIAQGGLSVYFNLQNLNIGVSTVPTRFTIAFFTGRNITTFQALVGRMSGNNTNYGTGIAINNGNLVFFSRRNSVGNLTTVRSLSTNTLYTIYCELPGIPYDITSITSGTVKISVNGTTNVNTIFSDLYSYVYPCGLGIALGNTGVRPFLGTMLNNKHYNRALSSQEIKNYHNQFAKQLVFSEDFSNYAVGQKTSEGYLVRELTSNSHSKTSGTKYGTYNGTSPSYYVNQGGRYGTWDFEFTKTNSTESATFVFSNNKKRFSANGANGYFFTWENDGYFRFKRVTNGVTTVDLYVSPITYSVSSLMKVVLCFSTDNKIIIYINYKKVTVITDSTYTNLSILSPATNTSTRTFLMRKTVGVEV